MLWIWFRTRGTRTSTDDKQIALLAKIIGNQGWRNPIVVSERSGFIVAGHGRLGAARVLNVEKVPVDLQAFENEAEEYAHLIADNRIAELAEADRDELAGLIKELEGKIDLDLTGFDAPSLAELLGEEEGNGADAEPQIDKAAELQAKWKTQTGQLWELGRAPFAVRRQHEGRGRRARVGRSQAGDHGDRSTLRCELRSDVASGERRQQEHGKDGQSAERPHRGLDTGLGSCSTATFATFTTEEPRPASFRSRLRIPASTFAPRSSGQRIAWRCLAATTTGNTSRVGMVCGRERRAAEPRTERRQRFGRSLPARIPVTATARRSRSSAWRGPSGTTFARRFTNRSVARAQPSLRARTSGASAEPSRSIRATSPSPLNGSRMQPARSQS